MRVLGLDFGSKTCGVAVCDPLEITVRGIEIIRREKENHLRKTYHRIGELIEEYQVEAIVLGYPLNMNDTVGDRALKSASFREGLEKRFHLPVFLCDERLTTVEADARMKEMGIKKEDYKKYVDQVAAAIILQDWLNQNGTDEIHV